MPGADISQVSVEFGNGIKREEYGPTKTAKVSIVAIVNTGEDGTIALNYISSVAQAKVRELLTIGGQVATVEPPAGTPLTEAEREANGLPQDPPRRRRRTNAEIAADEAAAKAAQSAGAASNTSASATPAPADTPAPEVSTPTTSEQPSSAGEPDEWEAAAPSATPITDAQLNHACSEAAGRLGGGDKVKLVIGSFSPSKDGLIEGRKFSVSDIPASQRADFLQKLKDLV